MFRYLRYLWNQLRSGRAYPSVWIVETECGNAEQDVADATRIIRESLVKDPHSFDDWSQRKTFQ